MPQSNIVEEESLESQYSKLALKLQMLELPDASLYDAAAAPFKIR